MSEEQNTRAAKRPDRRARQGPQGADRRGRRRQDAEDHRRARRAPRAHPKFKKIIRVHNKFYAHDEKSEAKPGDRVLIRETRPLSKLKRWELVSILKH